VFGDRTEPGAAHQIAFVGRAVTRVAPIESLAFDIGHLHAQGAGNLVGDAIFDAQEIRASAVILTTPNRRPIGRAHELYAHAHPVVAGTDRSGEHVLGSEPASDLLDVNGLAIVTSDCARGPHAKLPNA